MLRVFGFFDPPFVLRLSPVTTWSFAPSVPRNGVTDACVSPTRPTLTGTASSLPPRRTKIRPTEPEVTAPPPDPLVAPHGDPEVPFAPPRAEAPCALFAPDFALALRGVRVTAPAGGVYVNAATGTIVALATCATCTVAFAVIPGRSAPSWFFTSRTVV